MYRTLLSSAVLLGLLLPLPAQQKTPAKPAAKPEPALPPQPAKAAPAVAEGAGLKSRQSTVYGLLVMDIGEGKLAGQASLMNCTATQGGTEPAEIKFNQAGGMRRKFSVGITS